jgi:hypothetical protein
MVKVITDSPKNKLQMPDNPMPDPLGRYAWSSS